MQAPTAVTPPAANLKFASRDLAHETTADRSYCTGAHVARMVSLDNCATSPPHEKNEQMPRLVFSPMLNYPYWYPHPPGFTSASMNENTTASQVAPLTAPAQLSFQASHEAETEAPPLQQSKPPGSLSCPPVKHRYIVVTMERSNLNISWGLSLTMLENRFLIVGHVSSIRTAPTPCIRNAWVSDSSATPTRFWNLKHHRDHMDVKAFVRNLLSEPPVQTHDHAQSVNSILRPGDAILAVAGLTLVQWNFSLADITACLRRKTSVTLIVFRNPLARYAAWEATSSKEAAQRVAEEALCAMKVHMGHLVPATHHIANAADAAAADGSATTMTTHGLEFGAATTTMSPLLPPHETAISPTPKWPRYVPPKNGLFRNDIHPEGVPYDDDLIFEWEMIDSHHLFLPPICNFNNWLARRKATWRQTYTTALQLITLAECPRNPLFALDKAVGGTIYCDEDDTDDGPDDRTHIFVPPIYGFPEWLARRKETWCQTYSALTIPEDWVQEDPKRVSAKSRDADLDHPTVDFWTPQGFRSHAHWLTTRTAQWKLGYSWNRRKRQRLEHDVQEVVHLDQDNFAEWLRVRKNQWKVQRRKRQRERSEELQPTEIDAIRNEGDQSPENNVPNKKRPPIIWIPSVSHVQSGDLIAIDALLEEREREQKALENRFPCHQSSVNIAFLFDADLGCPDDTVARILSFLDPLEHGTLLAISRGTRRKLTMRENVWRQLCPPHWQLPRRPRKPWHTIYWTQLQAETERYHKNWDELLAKASSVLLQRDELLVIEKMVTEAQRNWNFPVDYVSSVVCERNSLLNLAVIHQRHKVVRWLVETKGANIESCDRGNFTALLNAAYAGDRYLVRFLMQRGADRTKVGRFHYTKPLSLGMGLTAEGWAEKNGHTDVAKLLRFGL